MPHPGLRVLTGPPAVREHAMRRGGARLIRSSAQNWRVERRPGWLSWPHFETAYNVFTPHVEIDPKLDSCAWEGLQPVDLPRQANAGGSVHQFAVVPFEPQELPFGGYSALEIQTGMPVVPAASEKLQPGGATASAAAPAPARIEEHFDNGWKNWIGHTDDWKIDAAGVRTGSLALFAPSLDLTDYDMEFLARIDHRSVTWLFRATDEKEYHVATIANAPGGRSFTRSTVIDGNPGLSVSKALRSPANPKAAITVQTHVRGNEFSVSVDGETIDRWTDNRLSIGGVGFMSQPDDRARLYWIRMNPATEIGKENDR